MKKFYQKDWFLKLLAVMVSLVLWIYVAYFQNPQYERWIRDIPITRANMSGDFENGKMAIIESNGDTVDLKIRGNRRIVAGLDSSNINVTADMIDVTRDGIYTLTTGVVFPVDGVSVLQKEPHNYEIRVDQVTTVEKEIEAKTVGELKTGYMVDSAVITPAVIKLTGPQSILSSVDRAEISVDLNGRDADVKGSYKVKLYNEKGEEFLDERVTQNIEYVDVLYTVFTKKTVDVKPDIANLDTRPDVEITAKVETNGQVEIKGKDSILEGVNEILTQTIDASNITDGYTAELDLVLPDNVSLVDPDAASAKVVFSVKNK